MNMNITPAQIRIPELQLLMTCDGAIGCRKLVEYAAAIWCPSRTPLRPGHEQLRMITDLHCCADHRGFIDREAFMTDTVKRLFEQAAKVKRPIDFECEFDKGMITYLDVREDEYKAFLISPRGVAVLKHAIAAAKSVDRIIRPAGLFRG